MTYGGIDEDEDEDEGGANPSSQLPTGTEGIWTFVFIDMVIFGLIFFVYTAQRIQQYALYNESHQQLSVVFGFANTLILVTSSLFMVYAVRAARRGHPAQVSSNLTVAIILGLVFCVSKGTEYYEKIDSGINVTTNSFFTFYFFITFLHLLHVIAGMTFMFAYKRNVGTVGRNPRYVTGLENVGHFWHFVDLLWVFIYSLLYLM